MLTLIDGNSLLFRAYYGVRGGLSRADGTPVGAVFGFMNMLLPVLAAAGPDDSFVCVFDSSRKTFRQDIYPEYKANRSDTPADLLAQIDLVRDGVRATGMPVLIVPNVEADDVIATLARQFCDAHDSTRIITGDKDLMQLVSDCVFLYDGMKELAVREPQVLEKFGVAPNRVVDVQSLMGDSSDNVPGVPGIGPKKAAELINEFGSFDDLYANLGAVKSERIRTLLADNESLARISRRLVTLKDDIELDVSPTPFRFDRAAALDFVRTQLESAALAGKIERLFPFAGEGVARSAGVMVNSELSFPLPRPAPPSTPSPAKGITITTPDALNSFLSTVRDVIAIDTETTGLNQMTDRLVGISLAVDSKTGVYIPLRHRTAANDLFGGDALQPDQLPADLVREKLWPVLTNPNIVKVGHNLKFDFHILENEGWDTAQITPFDDTMLLSYALHGGLHGHGLDELARLYLGHENIAFASLFAPKTKSADMRFDTLGVAAAAPYAAEDAVIALALYELFRPQLDKNESLQKLYENCDLPLLPILLRIERNGVRVDRAGLNHLSAVFHDQLNSLEQEIWELSGHQFNVASPMQLAAVLFDEMNLPAGKKRSTDADTLGDLMDAHPIVEKILKYRSIAKLAGTYADALPRQIGADGRIHTTYLQTSTNTGRLSSRDPNLQNIPIKTELGEEIRKCFVAAPDYVLISVDYSQIQLRLLAHVANVAMFRDAFLSGADIHAQTARKIFGIPDDAPVPRDLRAAAKTVNFSIIYGISSFGLATQLNTSRADAQKIIDQYMAGLPEVRIWMDNVREFALANGYVMTPWGRRIELPDIRNPRLRQYALRAAINAPIQGFEADLMRRAMVNISKLIANNPDIRPIMQVHDEIVFECRADTAGVWAKIIEKEMESVVRLSVPINADYSITAAWGK